LASGSGLFSSGLNVTCLLNICWADVTLATHLTLVTRMARILLVEDDVAVEQTVSEFLRSIDHCVISAFSAEQARLVLMSEQVDLAVIDCLMSGEQGNSLAEHVSQLGVPAILTSGDPRYLETFDGRDLPFLPKPFRLTALEDLVSQVLQPKAGNQSLATKGSS
jgi:DNA-binding NtrC family response regulator